MRRIASPCLAAALACSEAPSDAPGGATHADAGPEASDPLHHLQPTANLPLSPGNETGQDEDPTTLSAADGQLYVAWYSNRNGAQPDGVDDREVFLMRSSDGKTWTDPPLQLTRHARFAFYPSLAQDGAASIPTPATTRFRSSSSSKTAAS